MKSVKLIVNGQKQRDAALAGSQHPMLELKESILVSSSVRGDTEQLKVDINQGDLVELVFEDDTRWLCPPDSLEDIYPNSFTTSRGEEAVFSIPSSLDHPDLSRGLLGKIALKILNLFTRKTAEKLVGKGFKALAQELEELQIGKVRGLVRVNDDFEFEKPQGINAANPFLLFLHGTNSSTKGSFGALLGTELWDFIKKKYGPNILAFQHETLSKSALQNAVDLVTELPANATLHLITHSRGGLIGEILSRFSGSSGAEMGFSNQELNVFKKEGRTNDEECIKKLQELYPAKNFVVNKFVRVASPSSGTTILSKRLDYFFNISLNLLGAVPALGLNPIYVAMKNLLIAIIDQKNDVSVLPGLEAMKPESPFITIINNQSSTISIREPMVAISGNCKMKLNLKALIIIVSKLFFLDENDLVVNTKSMYNGSKRKDKLQFFFDEGTDVDHFSYFKNKKTNEAILLALRSTGPLSIDGFTSFSRGTIGEAERNAILGLDGGQYSSNEPSGKKPILILLPGIMGSNLTKKDDLLWINYLRFLTGQLSRLSSLNDTEIAAPSLIKTSYKKLGEALSGEYDVVVFPFDWRLPLEKSAGELNTRIQKYLKLNQPIKIVGHSMGGVLVRDFMAYFPDTWKILNESSGFRLLFLGAPLGGSFRINNVLFGEDDIINKLSKIDIINSKKELLEMFSKFPGLLCLLPFNRDDDSAFKDDDNNFSKPQVWEKMRKANGDLKWPLPKDTDLANFGSYRDKILKSKSIDFTNAVYIAGQDKATPCGYRIDQTARGEELVFLSTAEGDQSVTWDSGIPKAMIAADTVYYVNYSHGALSNTPAIFNAIKEILVKGKTSLLSNKRPVVRGDKKVFKKPEVTDFDLSPEGLERTLLGISGDEAQTPLSELPLKVSVSHGDLKYATYPLLAGHFKNDGVLYAEERIDRLVVNLLSEQQKLGIYPGDIGTYEIFLTHSEGFPGAIVIGLGEPDKLTAFELTRSVEQGITKYLLNVNGNERINNPITFKQPLGISSLIIACGYGGLSIENSVNAILQGIVNANTKVRNLYEERKDTALLIERVEFVELYEDRALSCIYSIRRVSKESGGSLNVTMLTTGLTNSGGGRRQLNVDQGIEWWNRITITTDTTKKGGVKGMRFSISTGAAREDLRTIFTNSGIEQLIEGISTDNNWTEEKARAIFELLIPNDFKSRLKKHGNIIWVLDKYTAGFPWELLQSNDKDAKPICINAGMIRQLATGNSRVNIEAVSENAALVVGDPDLKGFLTQLSGAFQEAKNVGEILKREGFDVKPYPLLNETPEVILPALLSTSYKIIHLAGHGVFNADPEQPSGMVLGQDNFLTTAHISQMSTTPELVFVNCCFLGKTDGVAEEFFSSRFKLAANIGTQLIENGVKAVLVAGWAVDDGAALMFSQKFYECMFEGKSFGDAVRTARELVYANYGKKNTWGAYQCYGDPHYKIRQAKWADKEKNYVIPAQAEIDLSNLLNDLKTGEIKVQNAMHKLEVITMEVEKREIRNQAITELEAMIYKETDNYEKAVEKFEQLMAFENASYSLTAIEQYCNLRAKLLIKQAPSPELSSKFDKLLADLNALVMLNPSAERYSLIGSAWKRKIVLSDKSKPKIKHAILQSAKYYHLAYSAGKPENSIYAYSNWLTLENILIIAGIHKWGTSTDAEKKDSKDILPVNEEILTTLKAMKADQLRRQGLNTYWDKIVLPNIELCTWMLSATMDDKPKKMPDSTIVLKSYLSVWKMTGTQSEKQIEIDHLDLLVTAIAAFKPRHFILSALKELKGKLEEAL